MRIRFYLSLILCLLVFSLSEIVYAKESSNRVRFGALPILDVLPVYVALEKGHFYANGLKVEIIPCASAAERDQLLMAGSLDLTISDLISIALFNREKVNVIGVRYAMVPTERFFQFAIVSSKNSNIRKVEDLDGIPIGVSHMTIAHYVTEKLLMKHNLREIKTVPVPRIPDRLSALMRGDLKAACLPDPFASLALIQGATCVLDDRKDRSLSGSLYAVAKTFADKNPEIVIKFLSSIDKAIELINREKEKIGFFAAEKKLIPTPLIGRYVLPDFPMARVPDERIWKDVIFWLREKEALKNGIDYSQVITKRFLEK